MKKIQFFGIFFVIFLLMNCGFIKKDTKKIFSGDIQLINETYDFNENISVRYNHLIEIFLEINGRSKENLLETFDWGRSYYVTNWKNILEKLNVIYQQGVITEDDYINNIFEIINLIYVWNGIKNRDYSMDIAWDVIDRGNQFIELEYLKRVGLISKDEYKKFIKER